MRAQKAPVAPAGGGEGWSPAPSHLLSTAQRGDREIVRGSGYSEGPDILNGTAGRSWLQVLAGVTPRRNYSFPTQASS